MVSEFFRIFVIVKTIDIMPTYNDYNETSITRGGFVPRRLNVQGPSIEVFANALNKIDTRHKEALAQRNQIMAAVGQLDLNEAEDEFKLNYIKDIQNQIDAEVEYGSYSGALTKATELAGNILADPKVIGRVRAQQNYKKFLDDTRNRKDISEDIKDWAIAQNPYHYEDKTDANGNVIGGSKWEAKVTPVSTVSNAAIIDKIKDWVTADEGSTVSNIKFDGNNVAYQVRDQWKTLSGEKLQKALDLALETVPGAKASLHQDYQVADWKYNNLSDEDKNQANVIASDIIAPNGEKYTEQQFIQKRFQGVADVLGYNNRSKEVQYNTAYSSLLDARQKAKEEKEAADAAGATGTGLGALFGYERPGVKTIDSPVLIDTSDRFNQAYADTKKAIAGINGIMAWKSNKHWNNLIDNGDYKGAADYLQSYLKKYASGSTALNNAIRPYLMELYNSGTRLQGLVNNVDKATADAIEFSAAIDANAPLPANNQYSVKFNRWKNSFGGAASTATRYDIVNTKRFDEILKKAGLSDEGTARGYGIEIGYENGNRFIKVDKQNPYWNAIREAFNNTKDPFWTTWFKHSRYYGVDSNNKEVFEGPKFYENSAQEDAGYQLDNILSTVRGAKETFNNTTKSFEDVLESNIYDLPSVAEAKRKVAAGLLTPAEGKAEEEAAKEDMRDKLIQTSWQQVQVYEYDDKTGLKRALSNEEKGEIGPYLTASLADDNTSIGFADMQITHGINIKPGGKFNTKGELVLPNKLAKSYTIVSDRLTDQATMRYKQDSTRRAAIEYNSRKGRGSAYMTEDGTVISNIRNDKATVNGKDISNIKAVGLIDADQIVKEAIIRGKEASINGAVSNQVYDRLVGLAMEAAKAEGYNVKLDNNGFTDPRAATRVEHHLNTIITRIQQE